MKERCHKMHHSKSENKTFFLKRNDEFTCLRSMISCVLFKGVISNVDLLYNFWSQAFD